MERNNTQNEKFPFSHLLKDSIPENLNRIWATVVIDQLVKSGVRQFYLSPGMRNAPLIYSLAHAKNIQTQDIIDERAAAYRALGYIKATGNPAALICTSGTAMANYYPAMLEANKSSLPLVIISADRPTQLVNHGANQSIKQTELYAAHIDSRLSYPAPNTKDSLFWVASSVCHLVQNELNNKRNPVHINMPFYEPLDATVEPISDKTKLEFHDLLNQEAYFQFLKRERFIDRLQEKLHQGAKVLFSVGDLNGHKLKPHELKLIKSLNCAVCMDVTSSIKYDLNLEDEIIPSFDHPEVYQQFTQDPVDIVIHIGSRMTSKHYYRFLENSPKTELYLINSHRDLLNPSNSKVIQCAERIEELNELELDFSKNQKNNFAFDFIKKKSDLIDGWSFSFPALSKAVIENSEDGELLFIANSTLIRSFDLYSSFHMKKNLHVYANRGVSGIEGLLATSLGISDASEKEITLVIGDISMLHDLGSMAMISQHPFKINIIVANNQAGGIFNLLPISEEKNILSHMQTAHEYNFELLAKQFGLNYLRVHDREEFNKKRSEMRSSSKHQLMEVLIDDEKNRQLYQQLKTIKS